MQWRGSVDAAPVCTSRRRSSLLPAHRAHQRVDVHDRAKASRRHVPIGLHPLACARGRRARHHCEPHGARVLGHRYDARPRGRAATAGRSQERRYAAWRKSGTWRTPSIICSAARRAIFPAPSSRSTPVLLRKSVYAVRPHTCATVYIVNEVVGLARWALQSESAATSSPSVRRSSLRMAARSDSTVDGR
jgi:hypothetical protein